MDGLILNRFSLPLRYLKLLEEMLIFLTYFMAFEWLLNSSSFSCHELRSIEYHYRYLHEGIRGVFVFCIKYMYISFLVNFEPYIGIASSPQLITTQKLCIITQNTISKGQGSPKCSSYITKMLYCDYCYCFFVCVRCISVLALPKPIFH